MLTYQITRRAATAYVLPRTNLASPARFSRWQTNRGSFQVLRDIFRLPPTWRLFRHHYCIFQSSHVEISPGKSLTYSCPHRFMPALIGGTNWRTCREVQRVYFYKSFRLCIRTYSMGSLWGPMGLYLLDGLWNVWDCGLGPMGS